MANSSIQSAISATGPYYSTFGSQADLVKAADIDEMVYSRPVCAIGYSDGSAISVASGGGEYRVNDGEWTAEAGTFDNGDFLFARVALPTEDGRQSVTTFNIGGDSDAFIISTVGYSTSDWNGAADWDGAEDWT